MALDREAAPILNMPIVPGAHQLDPSRGGNAGGQLNRDGVEAVLPAMTNWRRRSKRRMRILRLQKFLRRYWLVRQQHF